LVVVAALLGDQIACGEGPSPAPSAARAAVLAREDLSAVRAAVTAERKRLGSKAGEPEDGVSDRADGWETADAGGGRAWIHSAFRDRQTALVEGARRPHDDYPGKSAMLRGGA